MEIIPIIVVFVVIIGVVISINSQADKEDMKMVK